jgi:hypothetical protein
MAVACANAAFPTTTTGRSKPPEAGAAGARRGRDRAIHSIPDEDLRERPKRRPDRRRDRPRRRRSRRASARATKLDDRIAEMIREDREIMARAAPQAAFSKGFAHVWAGPPAKGSRRKFDLRSGRQARDAGVRAANSSILSVGRRWRESSFTR